MDIIAVLILLGIVQGFFLAFLLMTQKAGNKKANYYYGCLNIAFSMSIMHFLWLRLGAYETYPGLMRTSFHFLFLFGPFFYFNVEALTRKNFYFKRIHWLHFIPFVLSIIVNIPFMLKSEAEKYQIYKLSLKGDFAPENMILSFVQIGLLFIYLIAVIIKVKNFNKRLKNSLSDIDRFNINWIITGVYAFFAVFGVMILFVFIRYFGFDYTEEFRSYFPILVAFVIYWIGYMDLRAPKIELEKLDGVSQKKKYEKSTLKQNEANEYKAVIEKIMAEKQPYLDSELTINKLAEICGINQHHLSQVINDKFGCNFFDFVNNYRIEEAKNKIRDPKFENYTILAVANEVGFNSKSAFNTAFKKFTKQTPSQFRSSGKNYN